METGGPGVKPPQTSEDRLATLPTPTSARTEKVPHENIYISINSTPHHLINDVSPVKSPPVQCPVSTLHHRSDPGRKFLIMN